jgi:hypothetical protein
MGDPNQESRPARAGLIGWIQRHPIALASACVLLFILLALLAVDARAKSGLARRMAAIRAKGEPTTVQDLIARQKRIPDAENIIVQMLPHAKRIAGVTIPDDKSKTLPILGATIQLPTGISWPHQQLEAARWYLRQIETDLHGVHEALKLDRVALTFRWRSPLFNQSFPELGQIRAACKSLSLEAAVAAEEGDGEAAGRILEGLCRLSGWSRADPVIISMLTEIASHSLAADRIERTINRCALPESSLSRLQSSLHRTSEVLDVKGAFQAERVWLMDTLAAIRSGTFPAGTRGGGGFSVEEAGWRYLPGVATLDMSAGVDALTRVVDAFEGPSLGLLDRIIAVEDSLSRLPWYARYSNVLSSGSVRPVVLFLRSTGQIRALVAAVAAERFRLLHGHWPQRLDDLVPQNLPAVPTDPIDGRPIRYAVIPQGIKTWTISDDLNNADDGGDVLRLEKRVSGKQPMDFGWVILNPELRGRVPADPPTSMPSTTRP